MYDTNDQKVTMLSVTPDGTLREIVSGPDTFHILRAIFRATGGDSVQGLELPRDVDMWLDVTGLSRLHLAPNFFASATLTGLSPKWAGQLVSGTAVLAGRHDGLPVSLDERARDLITAFVVSLGGRLVPTMRPVWLEGGRAWEWRYGTTRFRAESRNGSAVVRLRFRTDAPDSVWTDSVERATEGRSAKSVAVEMFRDTTGGEA